MGPPRGAPRRPGDAVRPGHTDPGVPCAARGRRRRGAHYDALRRRRDPGRAEAASRGARRRGLRPRGRPSAHPTRHPAHGHRRSELAVGRGACALLHVGIRQARCRAERDGPRRPLDGSEVRAAAGRPPRQDCARRGIRPDRHAHRQGMPGTRHDGARLRSVRRAGVDRGGRLRATEGPRRRIAIRRFRHPSLPEDGRDAGDVRRSAARAHETHRVPREHRARWDHRTAGAPCRVDRRGDPRGRARRVRARATGGRRAAAPPAQRHRLAAPGGRHPGGVRPDGGVDRDQPPERAGRQAERGKCREPGSARAQLNGKLPMNRWVASLAVVLLGWHGGPALAQSDAARGFPDRPVRMVVPFGAAGVTTAVARVAAAKRGGALGQPVIAEAKPGAQGIIACEFVLKAAPDGHTILVGASGPMAANAAIYSKLPYDPLRDFTPVALIGTSAYLLVVNASLPASSVQELIEYAKARPNGVNHAASGSMGQLVAESFNQRAGTRFAHVPYKSGGEATTALLANEVTIVFSDPSQVPGQVRAGKLRALAITSGTRHRAFPDIPTMPEAGVPGFTFEVWIGLVAPAKTPAAIVRRLHDETVRAIALPEVRERLEAFGFEPSGIGGEDFTRFLAADIARLTAVARTANIKAD